MYVFKNELLKCDHVMDSFLCYWTDFHSDLVLSIFVISNLQSFSFTLIQLKQHWHVNVVYVTAQ